LATIPNSVWRLFSRQSLKVGVEIDSVDFLKTLNVTGVTIDNPQVTLLTTPPLWNYSSLGAKSQVARSCAETAGSTSAPADLTIKKLKLKNGSIIVGSTNSQKRAPTATSTSRLRRFQISRVSITVTADLPSGGSSSSTAPSAPSIKPTLR